MAKKLIQAEEGTHQQLPTLPYKLTYLLVAKHTTEQSCWVVLYGDVYDVTPFLNRHPGGSRIILQLSGRDATKEFDPIHPPGTLEENDLKSLGQLAPSPSPPLFSSKVFPGPKPENGSEQRVQMSSLLNLSEIEAIATKRMSKKAWAYFYSAGDDLITKIANNKIYSSILLRPRVFRNVSYCSTHTVLLGHKLGTPLYVAPAAMGRLAHTEGEAGIARGISRFGAMQLISNYASMSPEQVTGAGKEGQVFGWQLYVQRDRRKSEKQLERVNKLGAIKCVVLTLDSPVLGKREHDERINEGVGMPIRESPVASMEGEKSKTALPASGPTTDLEWKETLDWLRRHTNLPIVLKGVQTYEDAYLASRCEQVKAIVVSNHGGRSMDTASTPVHTLLEMRRFCPDVFNRVEVWVDGGVKRGTDVVKALCLGAKAVGVGRAALYGLGAGGVEGVERTFESEFPCLRGRRDKLLILE